MKRTWQAVMLLAGAACSESARTPAGPGPTFDPPAQNDHVFWARGEGPALPLGLRRWHGGDVLTASKTYAIYWGPSWNNATFAGDKITGLTAFLQGWSGSAYAGTLTEYSGANGQITSTSTFEGGVIDASTPPAGPPGDATLIAEVASLVAIPDPQTLYLIYGTTTRGTASFCGFHTLASAKRHLVQAACFFALE